MAAKIFYIPNGPKNLLALFPSLDFSTIESYTVQALTAESAVIATSTLANVKKICEDDIILNFVNYCGEIDTAIFKRINDDHNQSSDTYQSPQSMPLIKNQHAINRFNVDANETITGLALFEEDELNWLMELYDSPFVWLEWTGEQGQDDDFIPIVINNQKLNKIKQEERYVYEAQIEFILSNEKITIRG